MFYQINFQTQSVNFNYLKWQVLTILTLNLQQGNTQTIYSIPNASNKNMSCMNQYKLAR